MKTEFTLEEAKSLIDYALSEFYKNDKQLVDYQSIKKSVAENCMVFRIGWYLLDKIRNDPRYAGISLDCQYNRNFECTKGLFLENENGRREKIKNTIPDLLLHKRRANAENLMVLEFKKGKPTQEQMAVDAEKLCYYTSQDREYRYSFGFSIWLYKRNWAAVKTYQHGKEVDTLCYRWSLKQQTDEVSPID